MSSSFFTNLILDLSYGNKIYETVPGTALFKDKFYKVGEFINTVRAGEDIEWRNRVKLSLNFDYNYLDVMRYESIDNNLLSIIYKYFVMLFTIQTYLLLKILLIDF